MITETEYLNKCEPSVVKPRIDPFTMVIFGGAGDLSRRKLLPALFELYSSSVIDDNFSLLGFGLPELSDRDYRNAVEHDIQRLLRAGTEEENDLFNEKKLAGFTSHVFYHFELFEDDLGYSRLRGKIKEIARPGKNGKSNIIFYMAIAQDSIPVILDKLKSHRLNGGEFNAKIIIEKPFGRDNHSAARLNETLGNVFSENQIYRIEHNFCRNTLKNILYLRFSNGMFENLWNSRCIDNIQITVADNLGIEHHGTYYEHTGVVRDIMQGQVLQLLSAIAMEPPAVFEADKLRDEEVKLYRSIRQMDNSYIDENIVLGQYGPGIMDDAEVPGYRAEKYIPDESIVPTFVAAKMFIDNERWKGMPFYIRAGKRMARHLFEVCIQLKQPFPGMFERPEPNVIILRLRPDEKMSLHFGMKNFYYGTGSMPVTMNFDYKDVSHRNISGPFKSMLIGCLEGDQTSFLRRDGVEAMWSVVDPIVDRWEKFPGCHCDLPNYAAGTWGPKRARELLERDNRLWICH